MEKSQIESLGILPNGAHIYRKQNKAGGHTYYSDECGIEVVIWDTCLVAESTLLTALVCEHHRHYMQHMVDKGWEPTPENRKRLEMENMAATGGSFMSPVDNGVANKSPESGVMSPNDSLHNPNMSDHKRIESDE